MTSCGHPPRVSDLDFFGANPPMVTHSSAIPAVIVPPRAQVLSTFYVPITRTLCSDLVLMVLNFLALSIRSLWFKRLLGDSLARLSLRRPEPC